MPDQPTFVVSPFHPLGRGDASKSLPENGGECQMQSMDTPPPTDPAPSGSPAAVPPRKSGAKGAAKLTLFSPFAGLFILVSFTAIIQGNSEPHPVIASSVFAICWLIWMAGLFLGISALRRGKTEGRKGVFGRTLVGITFNLLLLGVTIWGVVQAVRMQAERTPTVAEIEATANFSRALARLDDMAKSAQHLADSGKGEAALVGGVGANLLQKQKIVMENFYVTVKPLGKGNLLNMAGVQQPDEIEQREDLVRKGVAATKALVDFSHDIENDYREELARNGVSLSATTNGLQVLHTNMAVVNPWIERMGVTGLEWAQNELAALDLLKTNWGRWSYDVNVRKVVFRDKLQVAEFNRLVREINRTSARMHDLQQQAPRLR